MMKSTQESRSSVEAFLLQRHRMALTRLTATRITYRILFFSVDMSLILVGTVSRIMWIASTCVGCLITLLWHYEYRGMNIQIRAMEETLAKRSGDESEDFYIKSQYLPPRSVLIYRFLNLEPLLWLFLTILLGLLRTIIVQA